MESSRMVHIKEENKRLKAALKMIREQAEKDGGVSREIINKALLQADLAPVEEKPMGIHIIGYGLC